MFYVDRRSKTYEGYLYKKGKMVKNWKLRWFILDLESKEVSIMSTEYTVTQVPHLSIW